MSHRKPALPKPLTLLEEAEGLGFELDNLLTTEFSAQLTAKSELKRCRDLIQRLAARVKRTEGLIDGYALNRARPAAMRIALEDLQRDSETRHPRWRKRRVA